MKHTVSLELTSPVYSVLKNNLDQAQHQLDIGNPSQAAQHMDDFVKHLSRETNVNDSLKTKLISDASQLIKVWKGLASK
jgi:beta-xylosidase